MTDAANAGGRLPAAGASEANAIREMIRHEDDLTNHRMTWFLTVQGLLFAALAFGWQTGPELVIFVLSPLGVMLCVVFRAVLVIGPRTVGHLVSWWDENRSRDYAGPDVVGVRQRDLPTWTRNRFADILLWPWNGTPLVLAVAWIAAALVRAFTW